MKYQKLLSAQLSLRLSQRSMIKLPLRNRASWWRDRALGRRAKRRLLDGSLKMWAEIRFKIWNISSTLYSRKKRRSRYRHLRNQEVGSIYSNAFIRPLLLTSTWGNKWVTSHKKEELSPFKLKSTRRPLSSSMDLSFKMHLEVIV